MPLTLIVVPPTAEGVAVLIERLTGRRPDGAKIHATLEAKFAARARTDDRPARPRDN